MRPLAGELGSRRAIGWFMDEQVFPTSFSQQRLWFLDQLEPDTAAYNLPRTLRLTGKLDVAALTKAFKRTVSRHESLRTVFTSTDGEPSQVVLADIAVELPTVDLRHLRLKEREETAFRIAGEEARRPFDLASGPLFRAKLLQLGPEDHILVLVMHHIITDGWSMGLLFEEIGEQYSALAAGREPELPVLPIQYSDYASWQRQTVSGELLAEHLDYWRNTLRGAQTLLELQTDHPRAPVHTGHGDDVYFQLSEATAERLKKLAQAEGATLFMALLTVFQILLRRYTAQQSILVGTPTAGRNEVAVENLIGFFVNTLVLRADITGEETFREVLRQTRSTALEALAHADVPFEKLVEALEPERQVNRNPLFQAMFVFQNIPKQQLDLAGLVLEEVEFESGIAKFDLTLEVFECEGLRCRFEFDADLFDRTTIERMAGHFETLLQSALGSPDQSVSRLPLLTGQELEQLTLFNSTRAAYPRETTLHACFEQQAERTPDATALVYEGTEISYSALNQLANRLAHRLTGQGVKPGDLVGISLKRSFAMVAGLLAILKTGAAYVPLDTAYPEERLAFMVQDSQVRCIVTSAEMRPSLEKIAGGALLTDITDIEERAPEGGVYENPGVLVPSEARAYVVYTSGSTGTPKGVQGTHRSSMNRMAWMWQAHPFVKDEICCQKTALGFVDSVWEIFGPLLAGVPSVILPEEDGLDISRLVQVLAEQKVSRVVTVPSLLRVLLEQIENIQEKLPYLKLWSASGEVLPASVAMRFAEAMPHARLLNIYGSSEVAADATCYEIDASASGASVPIGRPIANVQVHILDSACERVPIGVRGEIFVGGDCVALGYWNRPELTAERFLPNPFAKDGQAANGNANRLYRTGDLGRFLANGDIEYLGRSDNQVKLRGMRVELEEIEAALAAHPMVTGSAVALAGHADQQKLVGYLAVRMGSELDVDELRHFLKKKLPDHMVPAHFLAVDALPLLPNGKVDRRNLPSGTAARLLEHRRFMAPRTEIEEKIARVWREVLGVKQLGIQDNFFELGGHSLMVIQVIARIRKVFEVEIPVRSLFEEPTIERSARAVEDSLAKGIKARTPIAARRKPASPAGGREALLAQLGALTEDEVQALLREVLREKAVRETV